MWVYGNWILFLFCSYNVRDIPIIRLLSDKQITYNMQLLYYNNILGFFPFKTKFEILTQSQLLRIVILLEKQKEIFSYGHKYSVNRNKYHVDVCFFV